MVVTQLELEWTKLYLEVRDWDEIGTGKDEFGRERTGVTKNGQKRPWCNGPVTL